MLKTIALTFALALGARSALAKTPTTPAVAQATARRDAAKRAVLAAQVELAKARAALAEAQVRLLEAKKGVGDDAGGAE